MPRPEILLVHGAWHGAWAWASLIPHLRAAGLRPRTVDLPSGNTGGDLHDDVAAVRAAASNGSGPLTVLAHSYGGIPVTEALADVADVHALVYVCAFQLDVGESLMTATGGQLPPWCTPDLVAGVSRVPDPAAVFYTDVAPGLARDSAARVTPQTLRSFEQPLTQAAWQRVDSTYVVCTDDQALPEASQRTMAARATHVQTLPGGHSPFLSRPEELAVVVKAAASSQHLRDHRRAHRNAM